LDPDHGKKIALSLVFMLVCMLKSMPVVGIGPTQEKNESDGLYQIRAGLLAHEIDHIWNGSRKEDGVDINAEIVLADQVFLSSRVLCGQISV
jgi:hypothetical protein